MTIALFVGEASSKRLGATIGFFLLLWIAVWFMLFLVIMKMTSSGYVLGIITAILVYAAG